MLVVNMGLIFNQSGLICIRLPPAPWRNPAQRIPVFALGRTGGETGAGPPGGRPPRYDGQCRNLTPEEVEREKANGHRFVLRLRVPQEGQTTVCDLVRGDVTFDNVVIDDFIIIKSDGMPTYNFACVVDDYHMQVTHVLRPRSICQIPLSRSWSRRLCWESPTFAHVPMILAPDRSKLSKRMAQLQLRNSGSKDSCRKRLSTTWHCWVGRRARTEK